MHPRARGAGCWPGRPTGGDGLCSAAAAGLPPTHEGAWPWLRGCEGSIRPLQEDAAQAEGPRNAAAQAAESRTRSAAPRTTGGGCWCWCGGTGTGRVAFGRARGGSRGRLRTERVEDRVVGASKGERVHLQPAGAGGRGQATRRQAGPPPATSTPVCFRCNSELRHGQAAEWCARGSSRGWAGRLQQQRGCVGGRWLSFACCSVQLSLSTPGAGSVRC